MAWTDDLVARAQAGLTDEVREALWARGVSDAQIALFRLGYIEGMLPACLPEAFVKHVWGGRRIPHHVVYPITNLAGETRGFQFRSIVRGEKGYCDYLVDEVGPDLFGAGQAAEAIFDTEEVWLVEGPHDLFPVQRVYPNSIATLTARVTVSLAQALRRLVRVVHLVYDNDPPGRQAVARVVTDYGQQFEVRDHRLPSLPIVGKVRSDGTPETTKDPGDIWELWGDDRLGPYLTSLHDR